jgi:hypothetical protein
MMEGTKTPLLLAMPYIAEVISHQLPTVAPGINSRSVHVGFELDKVALEQVFSEYFSFHCQFSFQ